MHMRGRPDPLVVPFGKESRGKALLMRDLFDTMFGDSVVIRSSERRIIFDVELFLTGLGAGLPEVEGALDSALGIPTSVANPFQRMGISLPDGLHQEEHLWCAALGLAIRGYEE